MRKMYKISANESLEIVKMDSLISKDFATTIVKYKI